jgi:hypothetical protein
MDSRLEFILTYLIFSAMDETHRSYTRMYIHTRTCSQPSQFVPRTGNGKADQVVIYEWTKTREKQRRPCQTFFIGMTCFGGKPTQFLMCGISRCDIFN